MAHRCKLSLSLCASICVLSYLFGIPALSATSDWTVTINTSVIDRCLDYRDSKLQPMIRASVHFQQELLEATREDKELEKRGAEPDIAIPPTLYENLYSCHFRMIGMHRFKQLMIKPGTPGTIKIMTSNSSLKQEEVNAAANATIRLVLDLYLNKMGLRSVAVPRDIFDLYVQEIQRYGFRTANVTPGQTMSMILPLSVRSDPPGRSVSLGYGM